MLLQNKKIMPCCTPTCRKWSVFGFGTFFLVLGVAIIVFWNSLVQSIKDQELNLGNDGTTEYKMWKETPIPMYIEFYLYNWTNWKEVVDSKWSLKPSFEEHGPYTYNEKHIRKNVIFNDNHTVTYKTQRIWHFAPEKSKGSLDDVITTLNPILVTVGSMVKYKHPIVKMGVNFFIKEKGVNLTVTKTAREFIFDGYDDPLLDLLKKLHMRHINIPFDKFAWFISRNESIDYDGIYNMYDGTDDVRKLGRFAWWNYNNQTEYFPNYCGEVNGTSGELWYPVENDQYAEVFSPDTCSTLTLVKQGTEELHGVVGHKFVGDEKLFDNGTRYPDMRCFSPGDVLPSGVRNVSHCKFGAPAFISYPHFYLADPYYREAITGMTPNKTEHELFISIEPETGIPLHARVAAQINLHLEKIDRITLLEHVGREYLIPAMWFKQYAVLSEDLANQAKMLIILPAVGQYTGIGAVALGSLLLSIFGFLTWKSYRKGREEETLLNQEEF
ncbi:protein croquemort isoform X1 [Tribolium castaneum]|nr:PREDICTED: protein croquemort isoform X1 [Tribolium castaneum]|eukprot:XP_008192356.1 PREDICTED: protein croquemort isoform X1 [Tribolium castaneum]